MNIKHLVFTLYTGVAAFMLTGCLKKADYYANQLIDAPKPNMVELLRKSQAQALSTSTYSIALDATKPEENVLVGYVRYASVDLPTGPVVVKLKLNNALLPATATPLPVDAFTFVTPLDQITVPAGKRMAEIRIVLKKAMLVPGKSYGLVFEFEQPTAGYNINGRAKTFKTTYKV